MKWEEALSYKEIVHQVAAWWVRRTGEASIRDDLINHMYLEMVDTVETDDAKNVDAYVRSACWKLCHNYYYKFLRERRGEQSLDRMLELGIQVDADGVIYDEDEVQKREWELYETYPPNSN